MPPTAATWPAPIRRPLRLRGARAGKTRRAPRKCDGSGLAMGAPVGAAEARAAWGCMHASSPSSFNRTSLPVSSALTGTCCRHTDRMSPTKRCDKTEGEGRGARSCPRVDAGACCGLRAVHSIALARPAAASRLCAEEPRCEPSPTRARTTWWPQQRAGPPATAAAPCGGPARRDRSGSGHVAEQPPLSTAPPFQHRRPLVRGTRARASGRDV
mmetsp:Transcript_3157/g.13009  ORF Transcript_3157/g.13009 Transcript_3157/m.13009 type:complete len:213 (+) Transcript_3157:2246-2884(+)